MFELFDKHLSADINPNLWSDLAVDYASPILLDFTDSDWDKLEIAIKQKSQEWCIRCTDAIGIIHTVTIPSTALETRLLKILLILLNSNDKEVTMSALEVIDSLAYCGTDISKYEVPIRLAIKQMRLNCTPFDKLTLDQLENRLNRHQHA